MSLLKPRVMSLAIFTSICGLFLAPIQMHPFFIFLSILCISIGAGASGAINMWYDQDIDGLMVRTRGRPIPQGKISALDALGFGIILGSSWFSMQQDIGINDQTIILFTCFPGTLFALLIAELMSKVLDR